MIKDWRIFLKWKIRKLDIILRFKLKGVKCISLNVMEYIYVILIMNLFEKGVFWLSLV